MKKKFVFNGIKDFNLAHIFECGQCFRWNPVEDENGNVELDEFGNPTGAYIGVAGAYAARMQFQDDTLTIEATGGDESFWWHYLDLDTDYGVIKRELRKVIPSYVLEERGDSEANLSLLVKKRGSETRPQISIRILNQDKFETIISFIISQNNNIPRIKKLIEALCERYGEPISGSEELTADGRMLFSFPTIESVAAINPSELAEMKFGYRADYIPAAAKRFMEEGEPESYEDLIAYLGIGPKVANCIQLFGLHKVDAFPIDTWVKHIMNDMYGFKESDTRGMAQFAEERFGTLAGYAQQYLFFYYRK